MSHSLLKLSLIFFLTLGAQGFCFEAKKCCPGPQGPPGAPGPAGADGPAGATGAAGAAGAPGDQLLITDCIMNWVGRVIVLPPLGPAAGAGPGFTYTATNQQLNVTFTSGFDYTVVASATVDPFAQATVTLERVSGSNVIINSDIPATFINFNGFACVP